LRIYSIIDIYYIYRDKCGMTDNADTEYEEKYYVTNNFIIMVHSIIMEIY